MVPVLYSGKFSRGKIFADTLHKAIHADKFSADGLANLRARHVLEISGVIFADWIQSSKPRKCGVLCDAMVV